MDIIIATSRGAGVERHLREMGHDTRVFVNPGGKLSKMALLAKDLLPPPHRHTLPTRIYYIAGIPDITEKYTSRSQSYKYTECIYTELTTKTIQRVTQDITQAEQHTKSLGAIPIFCTIANMNIEKYNTSLINKHKTTQLNHSDHYPEMQRRLNLTIDAVNAHIALTNKNNNMSTPFLHCALKKRRGNTRNKHYIYAWDKLYDGVHGDDSTKHTWARTLHVAMNKNIQALTQADTDSDTASPKRSWKGEKRPKFV
jgi:hypothetical protein